MKWEGNKGNKWAGMSDTHCEQHPLLYEDLSEEEQLSPSFQRRFRPMVFRGRAKNKVKGAAAIIKLWPDHWSSSLTYWWIGLGMIAIVTLIIYNSVASFALLPAENFREIKIRTKNNVTDNVPERNRDSQNVYMHLFLENNKEVDLNSYMPYIEIIADKYPDYNYKLIIIRNDTNMDTNLISAEENNEIAFNLLWTHKNVHQNPKRNIDIQHITLTKYMESSPLGHYWRTLPNQFIEFLARAVSIWDKGGISFNPIILTPRSPHAVYIEKLQDILHNYSNLSKNVPKERKKHHHGFNKKVNNIRDIIDALEHESGEFTSTEQNLDEAENKNIILVTDNHQKPNSFPFTNKLTNTTFEENLENEMINVKSFINTIPHASVIKKREQNSEPKSTDQIKIHSPDANDTNSFAILPKFLDFLFQNKPFIKTSSDSLNEEPKIVTRKRKHVLPFFSKRNKTTSSDKNISENLKPVIVSANFSSNSGQNSSNDTENISQLTIDLKGNIIAAVTPCHAFLGTIFSNLVHHNEESLTDFIITELSIFCKGVLSSCHGIDVILL